MKTVLEQMLDNYETRTIEDKKNALKEVVQEAALCGLSRAGFFRTAAFYGGTALRIFYGLDRFSEDLDFSLTEPDADFQLKRYFSGLESELASLGLNFSIEEKQKTADSAVKSAFLKGNTREHILSVYGLQSVGIGATELIKIKFEIDTDPPPYARFENKYRLLPTPYQVKLYVGEDSRRSLPRVEKPRQRAGFIRLRFLSGKENKGQFAAFEGPSGRFRRYEREQCFRRGKADFNAERPV